MYRTNHHMESRRKRASLAASFFLVIAVFLLTGFLPQYLEYLDTDCIELSEHLEDESEGKKEKEKEKETEKETDKFSRESISSASINSSGLKDPDGHFHKWQNPSSDIITPPPEII